MSKILYAFVVCLLLLGVTIFLYSPVIQQPLSIIGTTHPIILAHRGSRILNPENTILAFQNAVDFGTDVVETDVQLTKDDKLIIFHDDTVDRVTNGSGKVANYTLAELKQLDAGYKFTHDNGTTFPFRGKGIHLSSPAEVFDAFPNTYFNIELKNPDIRAAELLYEVIVAKGMQHKVVISGRWCSSVLQFRKLSEKDNIHTSACEGEVISFLLHSYLRTSSFWYSLVTRLNANSLQVPAASGPFQLDSAVFLSALKVIGKHVHYWVINDAKEMRRLLELGANGLITDRPDIAVQVFESMGLKTKPEHKRDIYNYENDRFFTPPDTHIEVHTCVGVICKVLQNLNVLFYLIVGTALFVFMYKNRKKWANKKQKSA